MKKNIPLAVPLPPLPRHQQLSLQGMVQLEGGRESRKNGSNCCELPAGSLSNNLRVLLIFITDGYTLIYVAVIYFNHSYYLLQSLFRLNVCGKLDS